MMPILKKGSLVRGDKKTVVTCIKLLDSNDTIYKMVDVEKIIIKGYGKISRDLERERETFYLVLEGYAKVSFPGDERTQAIFMSPGDLLYIPPGITHSIMNTSDEQLVIYVFYCPTRHSNNHINSMSQ